MVVLWHAIGKFARPRYHRSNQPGDEAMPATNTATTDGPATKGTANELMTVEEALDLIRKRATVDLWPTVALALSLSRGSVYEAATRGEIEVLTYGRRKVAVTAPLRRKLGLEAA
jgi:hypothetical protein